MYDLPKNTMMTYGSNPLFDKFDFSDLPVSDLAAQIEEFQRTNKDHPSPETDAVGFYFMNHAFHTIKSKYKDLEVLPPDLAEIAELHIKATNQIAKRLFFYSTIIAVEEARYIPSQDQGFWDYLETRYGKEFKNYAEKHFPGKLTDFGKLDMSCGEYASAMMSVFTFGNWQPGFGGKGWAPIAALVLDCVNGNLSLESMGDQAFSLCHNNGSMFNKGHMYGHYSPFIYQVLDIQDSGQIPQWIDSNPTSKFISKEVRKAYDVMCKYFPDEMKGKVDMSLVKNSEKKREQKMKAQAAKYASAANQQQQQFNKVAAKVTKQNNVLMGGLDVFNPKPR